MAKVAGGVGGAMHLKAMRSLRRYRHFIMIGPHHEMSLWEVSAAR
jgi:hypothetical protein